MIKLDNEIFETVAKNISLLVLDVDGVLSDGRIFFDSQGNEHKAFNTLDGHGIKMLQKSGVKVGIITGRKSLIVSKRAADLGISLLLQGREDKFVALQEILVSEQIPLENIAFMGDDLPDLLVMTKVGLALTVPNAHEEVKARSHWQSQKQAGMGAVRDACDMLMKLQGTYKQAVAHYCE